MVYDSRIMELCDEIARIVRPVRIIIFNCKSAPSGELTAFKLCIVINEHDCGRAEQKIYLELDCDIPFDVVVYNREHWDSLLNDKYSFAYRGIMNGGVVLYESE